MTQPEIRAKIYTPEARAKSRASLVEFWAQDTPQTQRMKRELAKRNAMHDPQVREKVAASLRQIGHRPPWRGGKGRGLSLAQRTLWTALGRDWVCELAVPVKPRQLSLPSCVYVDIAAPTLKVAVEVDGSNHRARMVRAADQRKEAFLRAEGWTVFRFSNQEILNSLSTVAATILSLSTILASQDIHRSA
jgi:very-short-patch-repair endonuclease